MFPPAKSALLLLLLGIFAPDASALKFLFYNPIFGRSHTMYVGKLADLLVSAGHDVVSYQPINTFDYNDTGVKLARNIQRQPDFPITMDTTIFGEKMWNGTSMLKMISAMGQLVDLFSTSCEHQLRDEALMERLRAERFDFAFTEYFDYCGLAVFERIGMPKYGVVMASALSNMFTGLFGIPSSLSFVPEMQSRAQPPLGFAERLKNVLMIASAQLYFLPRMSGPVNAIAKRLIRPDFEIRERMAEASVVFVNVDEFMDFPRPISHKIHYIGGIGMSKPEPLSPKFEKIVNQAKRGFVFMSFGTVTKSEVMPPQTKKAFLEAFDEFPDVTFLWKYERPEHNVAAGYPNVITEKWWPQKDLLGHPKLLAFITHGGMNSISEAAAAGAPLIVLPLFADQHRNALMAEFRKFGIPLENGQLTKERIVEALSTIINDARYNRNAKELSRLIAAKPFSPEETFIRYSEFAARFDLHERLDLSGRKLGLLQFYNIDVFLFIASVIVIVVALALLVMQFVARRALRLLFGGVGKKKLE